MSHNVTRTFQFNYPFWMEDMKEWLQSVPDTPDMENTKKLFAAMLHENESLVHAMRIIGADMHGYNQLASILITTPALAGNAIIAENSRRTSILTELTPRASLESLTPLESDTQTRELSQNDGAISQQQHSENGKCQRGSRGGKVVQKAKQLRQQRLAAQTPSVVSSLHHPSIASSSDEIFIGAPNNNVDSPAQRLRQSHLHILQQRRYEEDYPSLPSTSTNSVMQSTTPFVRRSTRLARANLVKHIVGEMRKENHTKGENLN